MGPGSEIARAGVVYRFDVLLERRELEAQDVTLSVHARAEAGLSKGDGLVVVAVPNADVEGPRFG